MITILLLIATLAVYAAAGVMIFFGALGNAVPLFIAGYIVGVVCGTISLSVTIIHMFSFGPTLSLALAFFISGVVTERIHRFFFKKR